VLVLAETLLQTFLPSILVQSCTASGSP